MAARVLLWLEEHFSKFSELTGPFCGSKSRCQGPSPKPSDQARPQHKPFPLGLCDIFLFIHKTNDGGLFHRPNGYFRLTHAAFSGEITTDLPRPTTYQILSRVANPRVFQRIMAGVTVAVYQYLPMRASASRMRGVILALCSHIFSPLVHGYYFRGWRRSHKRCLSQTCLPRCINYPGSPLES